MMIQKVCKALKQQVEYEEKHNINKNDEEYYDMQIGKHNYAKWLNSKEHFTHVPIKVLLANFTNHCLDINDACGMYLQTPNGKTVDIPENHAVTEFVGLPNGEHYTKTYSHREFLQILNTAWSKTNNY